jgi:predicted DNA-binding helix-hairpin-helix protein
MLVRKEVDITEKIYFLGQAARFDVCTSSKAPAKERKAFYSCIYQAKIGKGQAIPLFKVLLSNACVKNCLYCVNRNSSSIPRVSLKPEELAFVFFELFRKGIVEGLFLSSSISGSSFSTMDKMIKTVEILRFKYGFQGYVHLKILPGAEFSQIERAVEIADRVSVNLEAPSSEYLQRIAPQKNYFRELLSKLYELKKIGKKGRFPRSGVTTQFVVGAAGESDRDILTTLFSLYRKKMLRRGYFSAYVPVAGTPLNSLPAPFTREKRLYQADYLLRFYGFTVEDLPFDALGNLSLDKDPKEAWAEKNLHFFPLNVNKASYKDLIKVPGIGPLTASRIIRLRKEKKIRDKSDLLRLGVSVNKAVRYIIFT